MNVITGLHVNKETAAVDVTGRTKSFLCSGLNCTFDTAGVCDYTWITVVLIIPVYLLSEDSVFRGF